MEIRRLPAEEDAVRRYAEELWLPYHRDLEAAVESHGLAEDADLVAEEVAFRMDRLDSADYRAWVAVESGSDTATDGVPLAETDGELVGFVTTDRNESSDDDRSTGERKYTSGQRAGGQPTDPGDEEAGDDEAEDEPDPAVTMTRLENTNVMRLLRNREFPVERDDFVTVASSAYEISPRKCEKAIQLAIKHDLIREDEGQLLAGDNWG